MPIKIVDDDTALFSGDSWNGVDVYAKPVIVTFSFPTSAPAYDGSVDDFTAATVTSFKAFDADERLQALAALQEWASASGIVFVEVAPGQGDINFQNINLSTITNYNGDAAGIGYYPFGSWTYASLPNFTSDLTASGDVFMNTADQDDDGTVNYGTLLHEIGHAIGFKHPTEVDDDILGVSHDEELASNDPTKTIMATVGDPNGDDHLKSLDKAAVAYLYGASGGSVVTGSTSGSNSVSTWTWDSNTQTLTQHAVAGDETIHGTSVNDVIYALSGANVLIGLAGNNTLYGGTGNDTFYDGPGQNTFVGGTGVDSFYVTNPNTVIQEAAGNGGGTVYSTVSYTLPINVNTLRLYGSGLTGTANGQNDKLIADASGSTLIAGAGNDELDGEAGNDILIAGSGRDLLFGGAGSNTFVFRSAAVGAGTYIGDFVSGQDTIDLSAIKTVGGKSLTFIGSSPLTGVAGQVDEYTSFNETILQGDLNGDGVADFQIGVYASGGGAAPTLQASDLVLTAACYCRGVRILTERGEVAIEQLAIGDRVVTAGGAMRPVIWIGHSRIDVAKHPEPASVRPIRVTAGAFADNLPHRDLFLSPHHNVALEGALIPISALANGVSIKQLDRAAVEYWHVELDAHDVIFAEGLPAESYLDTGNRAAFVDGAAYLEAHPDFRPKHWAETCLPLAKTGAPVERARAQLLARLAARGFEIDSDAAPHILVDGVAHRPMLSGVGRLEFMLPAGGRDLVLQSRTFTPSHIQIDSADARTLGLCVGRLRIDGVDVDLTEAGLQAAGWREAEFDGERFSHRWTSGAARLPAGARHVIVELAGAGRYWSEPAREARSAA